MPHFDMNRVRVAAAHDQRGIFGSVSPAIQMTTSPVTIMTGSRDTDGVLVFCNGALVAVLTFLSDIHADLGVEGKWYLEAGFGPLSSHSDIYDSLEDAEIKLRDHLANSWQPVRRHASDIT